MTRKEDWRQWIADVYHCSECWGQRISVDEMRLFLIEMKKEKMPGDYSPSPFLCKECASYWNELCTLYPS